MSRAELRDAGRYVDHAEASEQISAQLSAAPLWIVLLLLAIVPAITEEFCFRGFLLSGIARGMSKWPAILLAGLIFGIFHFMIDRIPITALVGVVLAYLCWQSRSIWPRCWTRWKIWPGRLGLRVVSMAGNSWPGRWGGSDSP